MCVELIFGKDKVSVKNAFRLRNRVLAQDTRNAASYVDEEVYWDGWVREEDVPKWMAAGSWRRVEIFATKFNQRGRIYDVPPGHIVKGIAFSTGERTILKVVTREAIGKEIEVQERFALTGRRQLVQRS